MTVDIYVQIGDWQQRLDDAAGSCAGAASGLLADDERGLRIENAGLFGGPAMDLSGRVRLCVGG